MQMLVLFQQNLNAFADLSRSQAGPPIIELQILSKLLAARRCRAGILRFFDMLELLFDLLDVFHSPPSIHTIKNMAGKDVVLDLGRVLKAFDDQEHCTERQGSANVLDRAADVSFDKGIMSQDNS